MATSKNTPIQNIRRGVWLLVAMVLAARGLWIGSVFCADAVRAAGSAEPGLTEVMVERLEPARELLEDVRSVRYLQHAENYSPTTATARRMIASYALAPTRVTDDPGERYILADFADDPALARYMKEHLKEHPVKLVAHLGPGLGLLEAIGR